MIFKLYDFHLNAWLYVDNIQEFSISRDDQYVFKKFNKNDSELQPILNDKYSKVYLDKPSDKDVHYGCYNKLEKRFHKGWGKYMFAIIPTLEKLEYPDEFSIMIIKGWIKGGDKITIVISEEFQSGRIYGKKINPLGYPLGYLLNDDGKTIDRF